MESSRYKKKYGRLAVEHFKNISDSILFTIKGHLIVEENLRDLVGLHFLNPEFLRQGNFGFNQILSIAKAIFFDISKQDVDITSVWEALHAINALRNALAHQLEPDDVSHRFDRLFKICEVREHLLTDTTMVKPIGWSVGTIFGHLGTLERRYLAVHQATSRISN